MTRAHYYIIITITLYLLIILESNLFIVLEPYQFTTLSYSNNNLYIENNWKLTIIAKIYGLKSLSKVAFVYIKVLYISSKKNY